MSKTYFVVEILGESAFHKCLLQSGWSGKDYFFHYNRPTNSHMRAYRSIEEYRSERVDLHKAANVWPILGNILPEEQIEKHVFTTPAPPEAKSAVPEIEESGDPEADVQFSADEELSVKRGPGRPRKLQ